jgi:hypothetical protein
MKGYENNYYLNRSHSRTGDATVERRRALHTGDYWNTCAEQIEADKHHQGARGHNRVVYDCARLRGDTQGCGELPGGESLQPSGVHFTRKSAGFHIYPKFDKSIQLDNRLCRKKEVSTSQS